MIRKFAYFVSLLHEINICVASLVVECSIILLNRIICVFSDRQLYKTSIVGLSLSQCIANLLLVHEVPDTIPQSPNHIVEIYIS